MGITTHGGTMDGGVTPTCNNCGISLCWDISRTEYLSARAFWEAWTCQECNGSRLSAHRWTLENGFEALPEAVRHSIEAFCEANPSYGEPEAGTTASARASSALHAHLAAAGVGSRIHAIASVRGTDHMVVEIDGISIDLCAGGHDEFAPYPLGFRTTLGWPIEPKTTQALVDSLMDLDPEALDALIARALARRDARLAA